MPVFAAGAVLAPYVIPALFGEKWEPSVEVMQILSIAGLVTSVASFDRSALIAVGRVRLELLVAIGSAVTSVAAFYIGAQFGIVGVATAIAIRAFLYWPVRMLALRAAVGVPLGVYLLQWIRPVACGAIMVGVMLSARSVVPADGRFVAELVFGVAAYMASLRVLAPVVFGELLDTARRVVPPIRRRTPRGPLAEGGSS